MRIQPQDIVKTLQGEYDDDDELIVDLIRKQFGT